MSYPDLAKTSIEPTLSFNVPPMSDETWRHDELLDCTGLLCPLPVLAVQKRLRTMRPGTRLYVEATDPMAAIDIPHFCNESGHRLVSQALAEKPYRFLIERT